ncbi:hypothetical protein F4781DRAFT_421228 [Annulohypoxylon bovei var. microspora]|nr:hypothetical protein F4781DRAFT_421228 [Annulohypoxylon bovei var. microspora]
MPNPDAYKVGWICTGNDAYLTARISLDEEHEQPDFGESDESDDSSICTLGRIGKHNVVLILQSSSQYGFVSAANVVRDFLYKFQNVRVCLLVGIAGSTSSPREDIRLGDVIVGFASNGSKKSKILTITGSLCPPPMPIQEAIQKLRVKYESKDHELEDTIATILSKNPGLQYWYQRPDPSTDRLYMSEFTHAGSDKESCAAVCGDGESMLISRSPRSENKDNPMIHYGRLASGVRSIRDAQVRDQLAAEGDILCFEMGAARLMNDLPCLVIRGICNYCDTHNNTTWERYAATAAVAYAKDLVDDITPKEETVEAERRLYKIFPDTKDEKPTFNHIWDWLSPSDPSVSLNRALDLRHPKSGSWFLQHPTYSAWKSKSNSFLWLNGIPGCGKTILSSTVIEDLENTQSSNVIYFYFDTLHPRQQTYDDMLRSLIAQLYGKRNDAQAHLDSLYLACKDSRRQPSLESLCMTFQDMVQQAGEVWIILDAVDECTRSNKDQSIEVLTWIENLRKMQMNIHIFVASRREHDIKANIERYARSQDIFPIRSDLIEEDIRTYIHTRVLNMRSLAQVERVQGEIETTLVKKADGMFRYVSYKLDELQKRPYYHTMEKTLEYFPKALEETYKHYLESVPLKFQPFVTRILQFLTYSERPLHVHEVIDAIAVNPASTPHFNPDNRFVELGDISRYHPNLIVIATDRSNESMEEIKLAHCSVKEYLISKGGGELRQRAANTSIAEVCLAYLLQLGRNLPVGRVPVEEVRRIYPMAQYAAQYWMVHAAVNEDADQSSIFRFFASKNSLSICYQLYSPDDPWRNDDEYKMPPPVLYYASLGGLVRYVQNLLRAGANINARGGVYGNALQAASHAGHTTLAKVLIEKGANVKAWGGLYGNALQAASHAGHANLVNILITKGADVNARVGLFGSALQAASHEGHIVVLRILLDNGANINAQGGKYGNALQAALHEGHADVIKVLLDHGANVDVLDGEYDDVLRAASIKISKNINQIPPKHGQSSISNISASPVSH